MLFFISFKYKVKEVAFTYLVGVSIIACIKANTDKRVQDNSPQDNSPHQNLAPRQLAPHSEDNSPQIRGQFAPHRRQLAPLLLLKKIKDKGVKLLNIFYQTYIFVIKCLYIYIYTDD